MPDPIRPGNISFDISFKKTAAPEPVDEDAPLRIVVLGNFGGDNGAVGRAPFVDVDNFDTVCASFRASLRTADGAALEFHKLDDFHPDRLLKAIPSLAQLVGLRGRITNPATAEAAAGELRTLLGTNAEAAAPEAAVPAQQTESTADMLARLLGKSSAATSASTAAAPASAKSIVEQLIAKSAAPASTPAASPVQNSLLTALDAELSRRLRAVMHDPNFQSLEAAWRGLDLLVRESGDSVKLHALAVSRTELAQQLAAPGNPAATTLGRTLDQLAPAAVLSAHCFGADDVALLGQFAKLAAACGTAVIAGGLADLAGCVSFGAQPNPLDWTPSPVAAFAELRRTPEAEHLGLALPRFLLRQPYSPASDAIETFPFTELPPENAHESHLWGSAAFLCGHLLVNAFANEGWGMELGGTGGQIGGLPVHSFKAGGETQTTPCAEAWLTDKAGDALLSRGLMPVLSFRGRDSVLLVSLRSIAEPAKALAFRVG